MLCYLHLLEHLGAVSVLSPHFGQDGAASSQVVVADLYSPRVGAHQSRFEAEGTQRPP